MGIAAAVVGAGALGAVGSLASGAIGASASEKAASEQAATAQEGLSIQQGMFNTAQQQLQPFINSGGSALTDLSTLLGPTGELSKLLTPGTSAQTLRQLPGFKFQSKWGDIGATNALAAQGLGGSRGPLATAISQYNQGLAGSYFGSALGGLESQAGLVQNQANMGANAASALAGSAISSGNSQASTLGSLGAAQASGTLGSANAISSGITGATGAVGSSANSLAMLSLFSKLLGGTNTPSPYSTVGQ